MIPKVIHYCWFGGNPLPELALKCIESWKKYCPDYEIIQWNEENYECSEKCRYVQEAYEAKKWAFVSDYARLDVVYQYGGIYLDTDVELVKPLDDVLNQECFVAQEISGYIGSGLGFGAEKNSLYIGEMLNEYADIPYKLGRDIYDKTPCPTRNTAPFRKHGFKASNEIQTLEGCTIYPPEFFCPLNHRTKELNITKNTIAIHYYNASWIPEGEKKLRLEVNEYRKTHGKISTFVYKLRKEFEMQYPQKGLGNFMKYFMFKVKKKILYKKANAS